MALISQISNQQNLKDWTFLGIVLLVAFLLLNTYPSKTGSVTEYFWQYLVEMALILPAVMLIMGLFSAYVSNSMIEKYLGKYAGKKGIFLSFFLGSLPTGPLYVAFPIASHLLEKGARISNVIIFLSAWACLKIPQELMEFQFLGWKFMLLRLFFTAILVVVMARFIEYLFGITNDKV
ncbi:permease [Methanohalophilus mahii]|uniref:Permease n=1 Tax=Methanohalophilus mahii (strain ATCC 35705 / DSM 5219 / SLP) TaxID=547558 RepID=D5E939_METMS|nr:permease [Methanohalophilus mahii]ADE35690.1 conserved hypothetical protein [Methanohalophilus mahii DSM 5219]